MVWHEVDTNPQSFSRFVINYRRDCLYYRARLESRTHCLAVTVLWFHSGEILCVSGERGGGGGWVAGDVMGYDRAQVPWGPPAPPPPPRWHTHTNPTLSFHRIYSTNRRQPNQHPQFAPINTARAENWLKPPSPVENSIKEQQVLWGVCCRVL